MRRVEDKHHNGNMLAISQRYNAHIIGSGDDAFGFILNRKSMPAFDN